MSNGEVKPASIRDLRQWVCWRSEAREPDGKPTKVPYSPATAVRARCDDPTTWSMLNEAREAVGLGDYNGIGFVFTGADPFCGVDLDSCLDPETGEIEPWAMQIVEQLDSYTEVSPSGTGLHVIVRAVLPEGRRRNDRVEMYDRDRFFTVTGKRLSGTSHLIEERQEQVEALHARLFPTRESEPSARNGTDPASNLDDAEILRRAAGAANGERFARLWAGDRTGYPSDSEADLALCSMLAFWTGPDEERIASLVARSGLSREKWNREDYRRRTIARALDGAPAFYSPQANGPGREHQPYPGTLFASSPLPEATAFPVDAMPAPCRRLVEEATASLCCAPELVALPMLAALSSAIGASRVVEVKGGWREGATLFLAVVASPGAMKTPAAKVAKKPVFDRQRELGKVYAEEKEEWKREVREWEVEKRDAAKAGQPAPEQPEAPAMGRCVAADTTLEALVSILEDNPRGLLIHKDELTGWVRSMDQYKGGKGSDRQHWLSLWSNDEVVVDRKSRHGEPIVLAKPFVSLFGGIQPAMLGELGAGAEDGLMDRFLFAYPEPRPIRFNDREIGARAEADYANLYRKLSGITLATDEYGDPNPKPLKLSPNARHLFARAVDSLGAEVLEPGFPCRLEGVWAKMRGYLARLSLVLAVCRCVADDTREERIEEEDVQVAARLVAYFKTHARRVCAELSDPDPLDLLAAELRDLLQASGGRWEGSATDLHAALQDREAAELPERPETLSKLALRVGERSPTLKVSQGWRKPGGRKGKSRRVLKLALSNTVVPVVTVDPNPNDDNGNYGDNGAHRAQEQPVYQNSASTNTTVATDARSEYKARPDATPTKARIQEADDGRERFAL